jgi:SAM-dependent methyltransferase
MSIQALREFISRHNAVATGLGALGAALDAKVSGSPLDPALAARVDELLGALGGKSLLDDVSAAQAAPFLAEIRFSLGMDAKLPYGHTRTMGWSFGDPQILQAVGEFARQHADGLTRNVVPALDGLAARFAERDATFLDIGVGVAGTAIAMAQHWPQLRIVGIDVWQPALALARENIERAGMKDRIELREQGAENLPDERAFDLAWMPTVFMPEQILPAALDRTLRALKPGGWLVFNCWAELDKLPAPMAAMWKLRTATWGGPVWTTGYSEKLLAAHGYVDVRTLPSPPAAPIGVVVGRRPA